MDGAPGCSLPYHQVLRDDLRQLGLILAGALAWPLCCACEQEQPQLVAVPADQPVSPPPSSEEESAQEAGELRPQALPEQQPEEDLDKQTGKEIPWPVRTGLRVAMLRSKVPTVDRVVLVPDEAAYLEAIAEWSLAARWPVLFEDDQYAPMFIRRFKPSEVIRKPAAAAKAPRGEALQDAMIEIVSGAWRTSDSDDAASMRERFEKVSWTPPGVVITSSGDEAWPAALALAADRGQPIAFLDEDFGRIQASLSVADWSRLSAAVESCVASTGYPFDRLGDDIDTVTIVRELPAKYIDASDASGKSRNAVTDGLARRGNIRWGFAGWIFGPAPRATYMAMCSIFLEHDSALLFDTYADAAGWSRYAMDKPAARLLELGMQVQHTAAPASTAAAWEHLAPSGLNHDFIFVNTKGNQNWFDAADGGRIFVHDVPVLDTPAAVHFVHSWSCFSPGNRNTLAGRWIERGAYAYVGSVQEPTLSAFVPPELLVERLRATVPFLIASRAWEFAPWRVATIGDPLMILQRDLPRAGGETAPIAGENLRDALRTATDAATASGDWTEVVRIVNLLGLDDLTLSIYEQRLKDTAPAEDIALALGAIFRMGDPATFMHAVEQIPVSRLTPEQRDMLWLKCLPSLPSVDKPAQLTLLRQHIRTPLGFVDACRIAPIMRAQGQSALVNPMFDEYEPDAKDGYSRQLIRKARR